MSTINIGGMSVAVKASASKSLQGSLVTMDKTKRKNLSDEKRLELFQNITKKGQQTNFPLLSLSLAKVEDLQETYDLQLNLSTLEINFRRYDILDVFEIVYPILDTNGNTTKDLEMVYHNDGNASAKTKSLFRDFNNITVQEVANSTMWYSMWPDEKQLLWLKEI